MRKTLGVLLIMLLVAAVLPARDLDATSPDGVGSPTSDSTAGRFGTDFDNYLSTTHWGTLSSNVLFLQFGAPEQESQTPSQFQAGTGYFLGSGMYLGGFLGVRLPSTAAENTEEVVPTSEIIISDGQPIGVRETVDTQIDEVSNNETDFDLIFGLPMGDMSLGFRNEFRTADFGSVTGTLSVNGFGMPGAANVQNNWWLQFDNPIDATYDNLDYFPQFFSGNVGPIDFGTNQTSTRETVSIGGEVAYEDVTEYADDGFQNYKTLSDTLTVGLSMPLGGIGLDASLGVMYGRWNGDAEASEKSYERDVDSGLPEYKGMAGVIDYTEESGEQTGSYNWIGVPLTASASLPVGETTEVSAGVDYTPVFVLYTDGELSQSYSRTEYSADVNGSYVDTVLRERDLSYAAEVSDTSHTVALPLTVTVTPSDTFRFSVRYRPEFRTQTVESNTSLSITETTTTDNGDPTAQDTVVTQEFDSEGREETYTAQYLLHEVNLGAQFYLRENFRVNMGTDLKATTLDKVEQEVSQSGQTTWSETTSYDGGDPVQTGYDYATDIEDGPSAASRIDSEANGQFDVEYELGFTYFFSESMELDVAYTQPGAGDTGNIWDLGTWSALMTIRY